MTDTPNVVREQLEADVLIIGAGPGGLACALHLANLIENTMKRKNLQRSPRKIFTSWKRAAKSAPTSFPARSWTPWIARARPGLRKDCSARHARNRRRRLLLHRIQQLQTSHHSPASAKSWQLRCVAQQAREMARWPGRKKGSESLHPICWQGTALRQKRHRWSSYRR